jgi:hypothetical protein
MTLTTIIFTHKQAEVLRHRMEVPDCIAEVWGPDNDNHFPGKTTDQIQDIITDLMARIFQDQTDGGMVAVFKPDNSDEVRLMNELVDGNTMAGIVSDMLDHAADDPVYREGKGWRNAMAAIDRKYEIAGLYAQFNI